jgi:hypothetical protein
MGREIGGGRLERLRFRLSSALQSEPQGFGPTELTGSVRGVIYLDCGCDRNLRGT